MSVSCSLLLTFEVFSWGLSVVQNDAEKTAVDGEPAVVINESQLFELVHEMADSRPGGAHHLRQALLIDFGKDRFSAALFAKV